MGKKADENTRNCKAKVRQWYPDPLQQAEYINLCNQLYGVDPGSRESLNHLAEVLIGWKPGAGTMGAAGENVPFMQRYGAVLVGLGMLVLIIIAVLVVLPMLKKK